MADSKLISLPPASSTASADLLYLLKPSTTPYDYKITIANLFGGIPVPVVLEDDLVYGGAVQNLTSAGAISVSTIVTKISSPDADGILTIADGTEGQIKVVVMTSNSGNKTLTINANIGHSSIVFDGPAKTATLMFLAGNWYFLGGTATVS
jgi:hypothetical protein